MHQWDWRASVMMKHTDQSLEWRLITAHSHCELKCLQRSWSPHHQAMIKKAGWVTTVCWRFEFSISDREVTIVTLFHAHDLFFSFFLLTFIVWKWCLISSFIGLCNQISYLTLALKYTEWTRARFQGQLYLKKEMWMHVAVWDWSMNQQEATCECGEAWTVRESGKVDSNTGKTHSVENEKQLQSVTVSWSK